MKNYQLDWTEIDKEKILPVSLVSKTGRIRTTATKTPP